MTRTLCLTLVTVLTVQGLCAQPKSNVYETKVNAIALEPGTGSELRDKLLQAFDLQNKGKLAEAEQVLDAIIAEFEQRMTDPAARYVSLANKTELAAYQKENMVKKVVWLDNVFGEALHRKVYLAAGRRKFPQAMILSDRELKFRPYAAMAFTERGFILNQTGKPKEGLANYRQALALAERFESSRPAKAIALRGIGFSLIELRQLKEAREAFEKSLVIDPGNPVALSELNYIRKLQQKDNKNR
jgi:tetratricopeptide (TPR) repeat protein